MNLISKRVKNIFDTHRLQKNRPEILKNTVKFSKKNSIKIIDNRIDYLTIKINNSDFIKTKIENNLIKIYSTDDIREIENINLINNKLVLFDIFTVVFMGYAFGEQKKIYAIYDKEKNKIGQVVLKNSNILKKNKNVINIIEFKGLFFKSYYDYLDKFLNYFKIDKDANGLIKRVDYCVDFKGIELFEYLEYLKDEHKKTKNVYGLPATDKKEMLNNNLDIKYGRQETYKNFFSSHNDLKLYDKILDLLENHKNRKVNGKNPYQDYLDSDFPIIRIELKKKKFQNLRDNSLNWVFQNIEALFFDYLLRYFTIDFSLYLGQDVTLNGKKIFLAQEKKQKSLYHSYTMAQAYLNNIKEMLGDEAVYKFLYKLYPQLENIKPLDLASELDISDYFAGISEDIINLDYSNENEK